MSIETMVSYDSANRELHTVTDFFRRRRRSVDLVSWRPGIKIGAGIVEGTLLADIYWDDGTREVLTAPAGCAGRVAFTNRRIRYDKLHRAPSQVLLRLA
jgi:hypothetical protein